MGTTVPGGIVGPGSGEGGGTLFGDDEYRADPDHSDPTPPQPSGPTVYKRYRIELTNRSITGADKRDQAWQLLKELAKVIDSANHADHQLLSLDLTLVTAEGDQGQIEAKAQALGAQVRVEDDDF